MRLLFLSYYYYPDLSAGSFRSTAIIKSLQNKDVKVDLITTLPNRYSGFKKEANLFEVHGNINIYRVPIHKSNDSIYDQVKCFFRYIIGVYRISNHKKYDKVYATSSRLMTAFLGATMSIRKKAILQLDIRDIFLDTIKNLNSNKFKAAYPLIMLIERFTFSRAKHINLVSEGFRDYFYKKYPSASYTFFTNGIDDGFYNIKKIANNNSKKTVLYVGNIGEGQGLEKIIPSLASKLEDSFNFKIIGDGSFKKELLQAINTKGCANVDISSSIPREQLINEFQKADLLFLHLNDYEAFKKVLPSKVFEYASSGLPIWAGVSGYARQFILNEIENAAVFDPCSYKDAISKLSSISYKFTDRSAFNARFNRKAISEEIAKSIIEFK